MSSWDGSKPADARRAAAACAPRPSRRRVARPRPDEENRRKAAGKEGRFQWCAPPAGPRSAAAAARVSAGGATEFVRCRLSPSWQWQRQRQANHCRRRRGGLRLRVGTAPPSRAPCGTTLHCRGPTIHVAFPVSANDHLHSSLSHSRVAFLTSLLIRIEKIVFYFIDERKYLFFI